MIRPFIDAVIAQGDLAHIVMGAGIALCILAYLGERADRRGAQKDLLDVSVSTTNALNEVSTAVQLLTAKLGK